MRQGLSDTPEHILDLWRASLCQQGPAGSDPDAGVMWLRSGGELLCALVPLVPAAGAHMGGGDAGGAHQVPG